MIEAFNLHRRQGRLSDLSLTCPVAAITAILGPNGAGKSTLLDLLAGRSRADSGRIVMDERPIGDWSSVELARCRAFLPQLAEVAFPIHVADLVALGRAPYRSTEAARLDDTAVAAALGLTDAWHLRDRVYQRLSGGERQRVQLARAIAQIWRPREQAAERRMLLLDEPTASLDPGHRLAVMRLLRDLAATGIGVVIALHDLNDALHFADHAILLKGGRLQKSGAPKAVLTPQILTEVYDTATDILRLDGDRSVVVFG